MGWRGSYRAMVAGSLLAVLAGFVRDLAHLVMTPSLLPALAAAILAGAVFATVLALLTSVAGQRDGARAAAPMTRRVSALRDRSWRVAFLRQRDPDAAGRSRPRAPSAALAAASSR
jgi:Family of unknown function (DUF6412)